MKMLYPESMERIMASNPAYSFAKAIGLTNYRWLVHDYFARDQDQGRVAVNSTT